MGAGAPRRSRFLIHIGMFPVAASAFFYIGLVTFFRFAASVVVDGGNKKNACWTGTYWKAVSAFLPGFATVGATQREDPPHDRKI